MTPVLVGSQDILTLVDLCNTWVTHLNGCILNVVIGHDISFIIQGTQVTVDPHVYDAKDNQSGDHLDIEVILDWSKPQNL